MARRKADSGRNRPAAAESRKAIALPLLVEGKPYAEIGRACGVSARTVRRWVDTDPEFAAAIEEARERAHEAVDDASERIAGIVRDSLTALSELVQSNDERIRLDATKTALDRFGHPVATKGEQTMRHEGDVPRVRLTIDDARQLAAEED